MTSAVTPGAGSSRGSGPADQRAVRARIVELDVVDGGDRDPVDVDHLAVHQLQACLEHRSRGRVRVVGILIAHRLAHWPPFVMIISGIADSDATRMTTR